MRLVPGLLSNWAKPMKIEPYVTAIREASFVKRSGSITAIHGMLLEAKGCSVGFGEIVDIVNPANSSRISAEVVGVREEEVLLMPFADVVGLDLNSLVLPTGECLRVPASLGLLSRVIDPMANPLDGRGPIMAKERISTRGAGINPMQRSAINKKITTGVKAIDLFTPIGIGQRIGIFAGSGVGKSTLLGMIAKYSTVDVIVIGLVGERGREVGDFIRETLGERGLAKAVLVVATAGDPAVIRRQAAYTATAIASWFRKLGKNVLLIMDSVTRFAMAQREIGVATGESVGGRGYPASVFAALPPLIEQSGLIDKQGSITAVYTVLVEGDDLNEPISDHMRAILDGHISLSRDLAAKSHYPAIDVLHSISRLSGALLTDSEKEIVSKLRVALASYAESKDLIDLGLYKKGANTVLDKAVQYRAAINRLLVQNNDYCSPEKESWNLATELAEDL